MRQQAKQSKPVPLIITTSNAATPALSPRTTGRNMLQTELRASLRSMLLWERQQKTSTTNAVSKRFGSQPQDFDPYFVGETKPARFGPMSTLDERGSSGEDRRVARTEYVDSRVAELTGDNDQSRAPAGWTSQILQPNPYAHVDPSRSNSQPSALIGIRSSPILHTNYAEGALGTNAVSRVDSHTTDFVLKTPEISDVGPFPTTDSNNLGLHLEDGNWRTGDMAGLKEAVQAALRALDATPEDHPDRARCLRNLGIHLGNKYARTRVMADPEGAVQVTQQAVDAAPDEITTATRKMIQIFHKDESQECLYVRAVEDPAIGPAKLEHNLRRLFKQCAEDLKNEARDQLDYLGARLVLHQATVMAETVVLRYRAPMHVHVLKEEGSDEEGTKEVLGETIFADVLVFIPFLDNSEALQRFQDNLERFVSSDSASSRDLTATVDPGIFDTQSIPGSDQKPAAVSHDTFVTDNIQSRNSTGLGGRHRVAEMLQKAGNKFGSTAHNQYDAKQYNNSRSGVKHSEGESPVGLSIDDPHKNDNLGDTLQVEGSSSHLQQKFDILVSPLEPNDASREVRTVQLRWQCVSWLASLSVPCF
ncbi:uncharacterized protein CC84DRAFT_486236 [Paraphaeosphaeria sporulosa]|uniref:DUF3295 domain-containing protein n=1 Tax=Paraphaeosphaeria sporulosa TaxID=1460663 RepID=A0A177CUM2_9PLEO|nr:uncharacterized protein CC84DRAFT_486236 [Paraphaeosphaeria sporulosa]OAG10487.1 hypothetical protein CC84DRAFT_486236 [Paraphaeosphaeria sporulosa]